MFIFSNHHGVAPADLHRSDLFGIGGACGVGAGATLALDGELVLLDPADVIPASHRLGGATHVYLAERVSRMPTAPSTSLRSQGSESQEPRAVQWRWRRPGRRWYGCGP